MNISLKELLASPESPEEKTSTETKTEVKEFNIEEDYEDVSNRVIGRTIVRIAFGANQNDKNDLVVIMGMDDGTTMFISYNTIGLTTAPFSPDRIHATPVQAQ